MKKILIFLGLMIGLGACAQTVLTPKPLMNMQIDNTFHLTDWFYTMDQGAASRRISGNTFMEAVSDSLILRWQRTCDSLDALRDLVGGSGAWSRAGRRIYTTVLWDSVGIGTSSPDYLLDVFGNVRFMKTYVAQITFDPSYISNGSGEITSVGDNMFFSDNNNPTPVSLTTLVTGGLFSGTSTKYPSNTSTNFHLGGTTSTVYKLKVTGTTNTTGITYLDDYIYFQGNGGSYGIGHPRIGMNGDTLMLEDVTGDYRLADLVGGAGGGDTITLGDTLIFPGPESIKMYQSSAGNLILNIKGHELFYESVDDQTRLVLNQLAADSLLIGNTWFNEATIAAGSSPNDSTMHSGSLITDMPTAKILTRTNSGTYSVGINVDDGTNTASIETSTNGGTPEISMAAGSSTAVLGETGLTLSDSLTLDYAVAGQVLMTSANKKIVTGVPPFIMYFEVYDTIFTADNASGITRYGGSIGTELDGWEISTVEAFPEDSQGDKIPTFEVWRKRGTSDAVKVTSTGANFTTNATINSTYKAVEKGDRLAVAWSFAGGSTYPYGANIHITFVKP